MSDHGGLTEESLSVSNSPRAGADRIGSDQDQGKHATSTGDVLAAAIRDLGGRGITNPEQFAYLGADAITGTVRWFDEQNGRVGTGVLALELRAGGKPGYGTRPATAMGRERDYGEQICDWLNEHFPHLKQPSGRPHPAAIAAVTRLDWKHGKTHRSVRLYGDEIRAAVNSPFWTGKEI